MNGKRYSKDVILTMMESLIFKISFLPALIGKRWYITLILRQLLKLLMSMEMVYLIEKISRLSLARKVRKMVRRKLSVMSFGKIS